MTKKPSLSVVAFDALRDKGKSLGDGIQYSLELLSDSRLLEQLPFVAQLLSLNEGLLSMSDRLFVDKFIEFLKELDAADEQNRKQLANKLLADSGSQERAGRLLLHYLNSLDSPEKSKLAGKIAAACARGEISFHEMKRHFSILTKVYLPDLDELKDVSDEQCFSAIGGEYLVSLGLIIAPTSVEASENGMSYMDFSRSSLTEVGRKFLALIAN